MGIRIPGIWNLEYCSRTPKSHEQLYSGIQVPLTKNPDSSNCMESVILGMESKIQECPGFYMRRNYCSSFVPLFVLKHLLWCLVYVCNFFCLPSIIALKQPLLLSVVQTRVKQVVGAVNLSYNKINIYYMQTVVSLKH